MLNKTLLKDALPLGIALSGGSDSTALLILAVDAFGPKRLHAVTINHGLRKAAKDEANQAGKLCAALGVQHQTITLALTDGADLQARARTARYDALAQWAQQAKLVATALGHTQDDVAETFLMRLARGSGVDGLAKMPARFERDGATFLRPLLDAKRTGLQSMLKDRGISWSEDPSNQDPRFTRVKMRQAQPAFDALGLTTDRLSQTAEWMRAASEVLEQAADAWIAAHAWADHGDAVFDLPALKTASKETACRVLTRVMCTLSGNPYRPRFSALIEAMQSDSARTVHGCLLYQHQNTLRVTREVNAIDGSDERWSITGPMKRYHSIRPLNERGLNLCENWRDTAVLPRRSLLASPAIWSGQALVAAPLAQPHPDWQAIARNPLHLAK